MECSECGQVGNASHEPECHVQWATAEGLRAELLAACQREAVLRQKYVAAVEYRVRMGINVELAEERERVLEEET